MRNSPNGFTLVEVLLAFSLAAGIMLVAVGSVRALNEYLVGEGSLFSDGAPRPMAPSALESVNAANLLAMGRERFASSAWNMVADRPFRPDADVGPLILAGLVVNPSTLSSPRAFSDALIAADVSFFAGNGFTVFAFEDATTLVGAITIRWWDENDCRIYECSHWSTDGLPMTYTFAERNDARQTEPSYAPILRSGDGRTLGYTIDLPDPSVRFSANYDRLRRTISNPDTLLAAAELLDRGSALHLVIPLSP